MKTQTKFSLLAASLMAMGPNVVQAQERNELLVLEEVLVVATRRTASLQDVPLSVSALSDDMLREQQVNSVEDLTRLVPSLNKQTGDSFNIRGIGTQAPGIAVEPSVSTMLDGVVFGALPPGLYAVDGCAACRGVARSAGDAFWQEFHSRRHPISSPRIPTDEHLAEVSGTVISDDEYRGRACCFRGL